MIFSSSDFLGILSLLCTFGLGVYVQIGARRSTVAANEMAMREQNSAEMKDLRNRMIEVESFNHDLWRYCRNLMDLYYRNRQPDAPDPEPLPVDPRIN